MIKSINIITTYVHILTLFWGLKIQHVYCELHE